MKKLIALLLVLIMALSLGCHAFADDAASEEPALQSDVVVLFTSDVHCGVNNNWTYVGVDVIRDKLIADGNHVILVDDGDSIQGEPLGTMTTGAVNIELMNKLSYGIAIPGNHEVDYGMDRFLELAEMADFPYISCNFNKEGELVFSPYVIKEFDGVKIAFIGITTPKTLTTSTPKYFMDENDNFIYGFFQNDDGTLLYSKVQEAVDAARAEGAKYVVAMAHLGNETESIPYTYVDVISNTSGINAMLDGHEHDTDQVQMLDKDGNKVVRSACGTKLQAVGYLRITKDGEFSTGLYKWDSADNAVKVLGLKTEMTDALEEATAELNEALSTVVARSAVDLSITDPATGVRIVRNQETAIGDLCADAYRYVSGADVAFVNGGGVRVTIPAGDITRNDILKVHPFGNMLCVCEATGQEILDALEFSVHSWPGEFGGWLIPSGLTFEAHVYLESPVIVDENGIFAGIDGEYRVKNVKINGLPLDLNKTYTVASHNYMLQDKGDGYTMFEDNNYLQESTMLDNQVLITYITEGLGGVIGEQYQYPQDRIIFVDVEPAA